MNIKIVFAKTLPILISVSVFAITTIFQDKIAIEIFGATSEYVTIISFVLAVFVLIISEKIMSIVEASFERDKIEYAIHNVVVPAVKKAIDGTYTRSYLLELDRDLSPSQRRMKQAILNDIESRQILRLNSLEQNTWVNIYDFSVIFDIFMKHAFSAQTTSKKIVRDYTVAWNAGVSFRNYSFSTYYKNLFALRDQFSGCGCAIRILIYCDLEKDSNSIARLLTSNDVPSKDGDDELSAGIEFEESLLILLKEYAKRLEIEDRSIHEIYKHAVGSDGDIQIRLIFPETLKTYKVKGKDVVRHPFNVYGEIGVSKSIVRHDLQEIVPIPHIDVSVNKRDIQEFSTKFDVLWEVALAETHNAFLPDDTWDILGSGKFIKRVL